MTVAAQLSQYPSQRCKKPLGYVCSLTSKEEKRRGNGKSRNEVRQSRRLGCDQLVAGEAFACSLGTDML